MASIKMTVKVEGLKELSESLNDFSKATSGNILKRAATAGAALFAEEAIKLAPRRSGALMQNILVGKAQIITAGKAAYHAAKTAGASNAEAAVAARNANRNAGGTGRQAVVKAGPTVRVLRQAVTQEFGTFKMVAHPYMRPAWDTNQHLILKECVDALREEIDKATVRAQKRAARLLAKSK